MEAASREDLLALIGLLQRQEAARKAEVAVLREQVAALTEANAVLTARVAELERKAGRHSGNSNMPPSTDVFGRAKDEKGAGDAPGGEGGGASAKPRRGKRSGAEGHGLSLVADPDVVEDVFPPVCGGCAVPFAGLSGADSLGFARRQCTDVVPVGARVTETRWHTVGCGCGAQSSAKVPVGVPDVPCYGPGLAALAVYLLVYVRHEAPRIRVEVKDLHRRAVAAA